MIASLGAPLCFWWGTAKALRTLICRWWQWQKPWMRIACSTCHRHCMTWHTCGSPISAGHTLVAKQIQVLLASLLATQVAQSAWSQSTPWLVNWDCQQRAHRHLGVLGSSSSAVASGCCGSNSCRPARNRWRERENASNSGCAARRATKRWRCSLQRSHYSTSLCLSSPRSASPFPMPSSAAGSTVLIIVSNACMHLPNQP